MSNIDLIIVAVPDEQSMAGADPLPMFVEACLTASRLQPQSQIGLTFSGYDADPREVYSIPRVIEFCQRAIDTPAFARLHRYFGPEPGVPMGSMNVWVIGRRLINTRTGRAEFDAATYEAAIARSKGMT